MIESSAVHGILITHVISHNFLENAKYSTKLLAVPEDNAIGLPCVATSLSLVVQVELMSIIQVLVWKSAIGDCKYNI